MIIIINGPLGIGKTSVSWELLYHFEGAAMLGGDYLGAVQPFEIYNEERIAYLDQTFVHMATWHKQHSYPDMVLNYAAHRAGVRRAIVASSAAVYGESDALPLVEETPLQPKSPYAVSKRVNEMYAELFTNSFGFDVVAQRYFNVYGPRQRPDSMYAAAIPIFIRRLLDGKPITIYGDGGQTRDLINIRDVVRANILRLNIQTWRENYSTSAQGLKLV